MRETRDSASRLAAILLLTLGGCPEVPDDSLEPNDDQNTATRLIVGEPIEARTVQDNPDVFAVTVGTDQQLQLTFETLGGEVCPAFTVTGPEGAILYQDTHRYCGRSGAEPIVAPGASLEILPTDVYRLIIPAGPGGTCHVTVRELGRADNIVDYHWDYRITTATP